MIDLRLEGFFPALEVPIESAPSATAAFFFLLLAIFTLTLKPSPLITTTRFTFCAISSYWFYRFGYAFETPRRAVESGISIICTYGIFRNVETSLGYLYDSLPKWVTHGVRQETPETFLGRLLWSLDLLFSMMGTSYFSDTHWDFVPAALIDGRHNRPRWTFVREQLASLAGQILLMDFLDTTAQSQAWPEMPHTRHPITTMSPLFQIYYAVCVCMMTALSMRISYTAVSIGAVALGSPDDRLAPALRRSIPCGLSAGILDAQMALQFPPRVPYDQCNPRRYVQAISPQPTNAVRVPRPVRLCALVHNASGIDVSRPPTHSAPSGFVVCGRRNDSVLLATACRRATGGYHCKTIGDVCFWNGDYGQCVVYACVGLGLVSVDREILE